MQLQSVRSSQASNSRKETIPYSSAALRQDLERVRNAWVDCQASRDRNAIYGYLSAVYGLVAWWSAEGRETDRARRALCACSGWKSPVGKIRSLPSFGAPPIRTTLTNAPGASGPA
jgi:hypothetical protein